MEMILFIPFLIVLTYNSVVEYNKWKIHKYESDKEIIHTMISVSIILWGLIIYAILIDIN